MDSKVGTKSSDIFWLSFFFSERKANLLKNKISSPDTIEADAQGFPDFKRILELLQKASRCGWILRKKW